MHKQVINLNNEILENQAELEAMTAENNQKGSHVNNLKKMIGIKASQTPYKIISSAKDLTVL